MYRQGGIDTENDLSEEPGASHAPEICRQTGNDQF